jgi:hypothetical protein
LIEEVREMAVAIVPVRTIFHLSSILGNWGSKEKVTEHSKKILVSFFG